jgi:cytochrome c6
MRVRSLVLAAGIVFAAYSGIASSANVGEGQRIYQTHCVGCHGVGGQSPIPNTPNFARNERLMQPDVSLLMTIKSGKVAMPAFNGILRDQQILDVIAYLRTLQR